MKYIEVCCSTCQNPFNKEAREVKRQNKNNKFNFYCSDTCKSIGIGKKNKKHYSIDVQCVQCGKLIKSSTKKRSRKCCSASCAGKYGLDDEAKDKLAKSLRSVHLKKRLNISDKDRNFKNVCQECSKEFLHPKIIKFCSTECRTRNRRARNKSSELSYYRKDCSFQFSLNDFPDEFNFELVEKYGWYSPSNKKNNLQGVSRDHIFSVREGFDRGISPTILSHPANCRLMVHSANSRKHKKSDITLEELLDKISAFNKKHNISSS